MNIYISGLYSGTNPQPGLGMVRSLRQAFPDARITGLEYSNRCSAIHWHELDEVRLQRPWHELDLNLHAATMQQLLDEGNYYISGNDLEILWLSTVFPDGHPCLLTPPGDALQRVRKPTVIAFQQLPFRIPPFISTRLPDFELHTFCRLHNWKVWLKGPYYEAIFCNSWGAVLAARKLLGTAWHTEDLVLQAHVTGYEESVCFSAFRGEVLDAVRMCKRDLTDLGKTWAGDVSEVPGTLAPGLRQVLQQLNWTGGGELEMLRDADDQLWLMECNPRFPAWIHGATLAGHNLVAKLVAAATGEGPAVQAAPATMEFTRVVLEVPVKKDWPLPTLKEPFAGAIGHNMKHPAGLLDFARKLHKKEQDMKLLTPGCGVEKEDVPFIPDSYLSDLAAKDIHGMQTPCFLFLEKTAQQVFEKAISYVRHYSDEALTYRLAYSIKTNPDSRLLQQALQSGFLAEAISAPEVAAALSAGFRADQIILNGPGKWWRKELLPDEPLRAVFCDSIADIKRVADALNEGSLKAITVGVRLRSPGISSRFGIPVDKPEQFDALLDAIDLLPKTCRFGVHFHMASSYVGLGTWTALMTSVINWSSQIEQLTGRKITMLDMGGGWAPDDWNHVAIERFSNATALLKAELPHLEEVVSEPGKAMAEPCMALAMRLLEVQTVSEEEGELREVVVDGSVAELPMRYIQPHRVLYQKSDGQWQALGRGNTNLLGRLCMEHDVVAGAIDLPEDALPGQLLVFCDAGAYDKSMSYVFGHG